MSGRREIVTKRIEFRVGDLVADAGDAVGEHIQLFDRGPWVYTGVGTSLRCKVADLIALAELLKQEKP